MTNEFTIKHKLPSLNDYVLACRTNRFQGAKFKREIEEFIEWSIRSALTRKTLCKPKKAAIVRFTWTEKTRRRDCDNIASAKKFILDALVKMKVLENDTQKHVVGFYDAFEIGKDYSVRVELIEKET